MIKGSGEDSCMSVRRYELSDFARSIIAPLLPNKPRANDRKVLNGIY